MNNSIVFCGKGGVGKTTLAALLTRLIIEKKELKALVIDADPTGGLSLALSLPIKKTINDLRKEVVAAAKEKRIDTSSLAASVDYRLLESLTEYENIAFLAVGRPEEEGCYCQVNTFLRSSIEYLSDKFDLVIIDAEAGVEQVNRRVVSSVNRLFLVTDLSQRGLRVAETVHQVASTSGKYNEIGLIINRVSSEDALKIILQDIKLPLVGHLPEDGTISSFDAAGKTFLELPACPSLRAASRLFESIIYF